MLICCLFEVVVIVIVVVVVVVVVVIICHVTLAHQQGKNMIMLTSQVPILLTDSDPDPDDDHLTSDHQKRDGKGRSCLRLSLPLLDPPG